MFAGQIKGAFCFGQNPAVGGPNAQMAREALDKLDWLVVADLFEHETATHWMRPGVDPKNDPDRGFPAAAAASIEKEGSIVNSGRWMQWRYTAVSPPGEAKADLDIVDGLVRALKAAYAEGGAFPEPIRELAWDYGGETGHVDPHQVAKEINGSFLVDVEGADGAVSKAGTQVPGFAALRDDGSTASGNWLYCGSYTEAGNQSARRDATDAMNGIGIHPNWAWVWPMNRRILYNRCSVDLEGNPYNPEQVGDPLERRVEELGGRRARRRHAAGRAALHHVARWRRTALRARSRGRAVARALRAGREPDQQPDVFAGVQPRGQGVGARRNSTVSVAREGVPDRRHHLSRFRALADRCNEPEHALARRSDARCLLRDRHPPRAQTRSIENGDRVKIRSARGEVEVYALVTERFQALLRRRGKHRAPDRNPVALGLGGARARRQRQRAHSQRRRSQHDDPRVQGLPVRHSPPRRSESRRNA